MLRTLPILCVVGSLAVACATLPCQAAPSDSQSGLSASAEPVDLAPRADEGAAPPAADARSGSDDSSGSFRPPFNMSLALLLGSAYLVVRRMRRTGTSRSPQAGRDSDRTSSGFNPRSVEQAIADALARRGDGY